MAGFVYVMSNPGFDGRVKIGKSIKDPTVDRVSELNNSTSVPEPFKVEYYCYVDKFDELETRVHRLLSDSRPNRKREFFKVDLQTAISTIQEVASELGGVKFEEFHFEESIRQGPWNRRQEMVGAEIGFSSKDGETKVGESGPYSQTTTTAQAGEQQRREDEFHEKEMYRIERRNKRFLIFTFILIAFGFWAMNGYRLSLF